MPARKIPFVTGQVYHVFNRGVNKISIFRVDREYRRAKDTCSFYRFIKPGISFSDFMKSDLKRQFEIKRLIVKNGLLVDIFAYCLMPNHFHFLLMQKVDGGVSKFLSNFQNSYTKYFNLRNKRQGSLLLTPFKAVKIEDDDQLIHVSRYIHLNPYAAHLVASVDDLENYSWSSLGEYLNLKEKGFCRIKKILSFFESTDEYLKFVSNQADYQRELKRIEHITFD
jgi:putative transposase